MPSLSQLTVKKVLNQGPMNDDATADQASYARGLAPEMSAPSFRRGTVGHLVRSELGSLESRARAAGARGDTDTVNQILGEMNSLIDSNRGALESAAGYTGANPHQTDIAARSQRFLTGEFMNGSGDSGSLYEMADENSEQAQKYRAMRVRQGGDLGTVARLSESDDGFTQFTLASLGFGRNADPTLQYTDIGNEQRSLALSRLNKANARASAYGGETEAYYNAYKWNVDSFGGVTSEAYEGAGYDDGMIQLMEATVGGALTNRNLTSAATVLNRLSHSFYSGADPLAAKTGGGSIERQGDTPLFHRGDRDKTLFMDAAWASLTLAKEWAGSSELPPEDACAKMELLMTSDFRRELETQEANGAFHSATALEKRRKIIEFARSYLYDKAPDLTPNFQGYDPIWNASKASKGVASFLDTDENRELTAASTPSPDGRTPSVSGDRYDLTTAETDAENALAFPMQAVSDAINKFLPVFARTEGFTGSHHQFVPAMLNDADTLNHIITDVSERMGWANDISESLIREFSRQLSANPTGKFDYNLAFDSVTHAGVSEEALRESGQKYHAAVSQWAASNNLSEDQRRDSFSRVFQQTQGYDPGTVQLLDLDTGDFSGDFVEHNLTLDDQSRFVSSLGRATKDDTKAYSHQLMQSYGSLLAAESKSQAEQRAAQAKAAAEDPEATPFDDPVDAPQTDAAAEAWQKLLASATPISLPGDLSSKGVSLKALLDNALSGADSPEIAKQAEAFVSAVRGNNLAVATESLKALLDNHAAKSFNSKDDPVRRSANIKLLKGTATRDLSILAHKMSKSMTIGQRRAIAATARQALELVTSAIEDGRISASDLSAAGDAVNGPGQGLQNLALLVAQVSPQTASQLVDQVFGAAGYDEATRKMIKFYNQSHASAFMLNEAVVKWQKDRNDDWADDNPNLIPGAGVIGSGAVGVGVPLFTQGWAGAGIGAAPVVLSALGDFADRRLATDDGKPRDKVKISDLPQDNPIRQTWENAGLDMNVLVEKDFATDDDLNGSPWGRIARTGGAGGGVGAAIGSIFGNTGAGIGAIIGTAIGGLAQGVQELFFTPGQDERKEQLASLLENQTLSLMSTFSGTPAEELVVGRVRQLRKFLRENPGLDAGERGNAWARTYSALVKEISNAAGSLMQGQNPGGMMMQLFGGNANDRAAAQVMSQVETRRRFSSKGTAKDEESAKRMYAALTRHQRPGGNKRVQRNVTAAVEELLPDTVAGKNPGLKAQVTEKLVSMCDEHVVTSADGQAPSNQQIRKYASDSLQFVLDQYAQAQQAAELATYEQKESIKAQQDLAGRIRLEQLKQENKLVEIDRKNQAQAERDRANREHDRQQWNAQAALAAGKDPEGFSTDAYTQAFDTLNARQ